ncbi:hypothetical protein JA9_003279 [Meyerozyma sp. JA9]|nr:hypothetical protein JA9_003279 [Meyerozyma sp. JA9]
MSDSSRQMSESYYYLSRDDTTDLQSFSPMSKASDTSALIRLAGDFDNSEKSKIRNRSPTAHISSHSTPLARKHEDGGTHNKIDHFRRFSGAGNDANNDLEARLKPLLRQELNDFKAEMEAMIRNQEQKRHHSAKERVGASSTPIRVENHENGPAHDVSAQSPGPKFDNSVPDSPVTTPPNSHEYTKASFGPSASFGYPNVTSPSPINPNPETPLNEEFHTNNDTERLRMELARLQAENHQLQARNVDLTLHVNELEFELQNQQNVDITSSQIDISELKPPSTVKPITMDSVPPEFRKHYKKLNLDIIDSISDTEVRNTLKNVMLSLLICDYQSLPEMSVKIANYIRVTGEFMDGIHEKLYDIQGSIRPSSYLRAEMPDAQARFVQCLHQMAEQIPN